MIHRRSKISRLPEPIQTQINEFLDANAHYSRILKWLAQQGYPDFQPYHITRWRYSGYLDWLQDQEQEHQLDRKLRWAEKQAASGPNSTLRAAMSVIALKLYDALNRADSCDLNMLLHAKPEKIATLANSFARCSRELLAQDRFQEDRRRRAAPARVPEPQKLRNPNRKRPRKLRLFAPSCTHLRKNTPEQKNLSHVQLPQKSCS